MPPPSSLIYAEPQRGMPPTSHPPALFSRVDRAGAHATVWVVGRVDRAAITRIGGWLRGLTAAGVQHLTVDVFAATGCNGALLALLAHAHAQQGAELISFKVVGVQLPEFLAALPGATLDELFIIYDVVRRESSCAPGRASSLTSGDAELGHRPHRGRVVPERERRGGDPHPESLGPQERRIPRLIAGGPNNRQVGTEMYRAEKT